MAFYEFSQNNSGGSFDHDRDAGIGYSVWIEANNADQANALAEGIGLYFDGCDTGSDCACCGDRWYRAWSDKGHEKPQNYDGGEVTGGWGISSYVHYLDGTMEEFPDPKGNR